MVIKGGFQSLCFAYIIKFYGSNVIEWSTSNRKYDEDIIQVSW